MPRIDYDYSGPDVAPDGPPAMPMDNSWVIVRREDGEVMGEVTEPFPVDKLNKAKYRAVRAYRYLQLLNKAVQSEREALI